MSGIGMEVLRGAEVEVDRVETELHESLFHSHCTAQWIVRLL